MEQTLLPGCSGGIPEAGQAMGSLKKKVIQAVIIDDEPFARADLSASLAELAGPRIEIIGEAGSLSEGRDLLNRVLPHVLFLDLDLRGGNGLDLLDAVGPKTRVVAVSAHADLLKEAADAGVQHRLDKPVTQEGLLSALAGITY